MPESGVAPQTYAILRKKSRWRSWIVTMRVLEPGRIMLKDRIRRRIRAADTTRGIWNVGPLYLVQILAHRQCVIHAIQLLR